MDTEKILSLFLFFDFFLIHLELYTEKECPHIEKNDIRRHLSFADWLDVKVSSVPICRSFVEIWQYFYVTDGHRPIYNY